MARLAWLICLLWLSFLNNLGYSQITISEATSERSMSLAIPEELSVAISIVGERARFHAADSLRHVELHKPPSEALTSFSQMTPRIIFRGAKSNRFLRSELKEVSEETSPPPTINTQLASNEDTTSDTAVKVETPTEVSDETEVSEASLTEEVDSLPVQEVVQPPAVRIMYPSSETVWTKSTLELTLRITNPSQENLKYFVTLNGKQLVGIKDATIEPSADFVNLNYRLPSDLEPGENLELAVIVETATSQVTSQPTTIRFRYGGSSENKEFNRLAFVLGNANYQQNSQLANPINDATGVAEALRSVGYSVTFHTDLNHDQMIKELNAFAAGVNPNDEVLFYFSGHGLGIDGENYLLPVDTTISPTEVLSDIAYNPNDLLKKLENAKSRVNIIILDACRNNPFQTKRAVSSKGLTEIRVKPTGTYIAFAAAPGSFADDLDPKNPNNSPFSGALIEALKTPNLEIEDVFKQVKRHVQEVTDKQQVPWTSSSLVEDYYFLQENP